MTRTRRGRCSRPFPGEAQQKKYYHSEEVRIRFVGYKDPEFLKEFLNDQGKIPPRRITDNSLKLQRRVAQAVKRARRPALLPFATDLMK